ncbi:MAG: hypothetical protein ACHQWU_02750, partial [Gemmatimonadales bacterium]
MARRPHIPRTPPLMSRFLSAVLAGSLVAASLHAQSVKPVWPDEGPFKWAPRPTSPDITANDLRTRLYQFADDSMQGRRIGEPGNYKGTAYIASEFKRIGLAPGGEKGTYFQELPYGPLGFDSASSRLIAASSPLTASTEWVPIAPTAANGFGSTADLNALPTVFAGRWGDTTPLDPATFRGKIAVFIATPAAAGLSGGRGGAGGAGGRLERCDSIPSKFGAEAAVQVEAAIARIDAADSAAGRARRGRGGRGGNAVRDRRAEAAGAAGILLIALDQAPRAAIQGAFA